MLILVSLIKELKGGSDADAAKDQRRGVHVFKMKIAAAEAYAKITAYGILAGHISSKRQCENDWHQGEIFHDEWASR